MITLSRLLPLLVVLTIALVVAWALVNWLTTKARREYASSAARIDRVRTMSNQAAAASLAQLLHEGTTLRGVESVVPPSSLAHDLPPLLREFLSRYQRVETIAGQYTAVDRGLVRESPMRTGYLTIGKGMEATDVEYEIAIRAGQEGIFSLHPNEDPDPVFGMQPTIYHFLVGLASEVQESRDT